MKKLQKMQNEHKIEIIGNPRNIKYYDPLGDPDLIEKNRKSDVFFLTRVAIQPRTIKNLFKIPTF